MTDTIFQQIIDKELPADILYEDELCLAINDLYPQAPVHVLIIPKQSIAKIADATSNDQQLIGHLILIANKVACQLNIEDAFRLVINNGAKSAQAIFHLHVHLLGGRIMKWPPG